ncbi:hypothetical protein ACOME3_005924 [Neoechinorhynchus agilis]
MRMFLLPMFQLQSISYVGQTNNELIRAKSKSGVNSTIVSHIDGHEINFDGVELQTTVLSMRPTSPDGFYVPGPVVHCEPTFNYKPVRPEAFFQPTAPSSTDQEEKPLLEELGIDLSSIWKQTAFVMNPFVASSSCTSDELLLSDLTGPLVFIVAFAFSLLFGLGKHYFGYIYGYSSVGCLLMYGLLAAMDTAYSKTNQSSMITLAFTTSALGYCLLPIVALSFVWPILKLSNLNSGILAAFVVVVAIGWSTYAAARLLATAMVTDQQTKRGLRILVGYPCLLFYVVFALFVIF